MSRNDPGQHSDITREQIERGAAALVPFVQAWNLPLNPEDLDELAYAVLTHGQKRGPIDPAEWERIDRAVREQLEEAARSRAGLYKD
jgi:hypothetical protein